MIISAQVFLAGLTGPWALIEFGYLLWFGIINWNVLSNDVRKKYVRTFLVVVWWNWCVMCDDWVIDLYVIILVEMKPVYW